MRYPLHWTLMYLVYCHSPRNWQKPTLHEVVNLFSNNYSWSTKTHSNLLRLTCGTQLPLQSRRINISIGALTRAPHGLAYSPRHCTHSWLISDLALNLTEAQPSVDTFYKDIGKNSLRLRLSSNSSGSNDSRFWALTSRRTAVKKLSCSPLTERSLAILFSKTKPPPFQTKHTEHGQKHAGRSLRCWLLRSTIQDSNPFSSICNQVTATKFLPIDGSMISRRTFLVYCVSILTFRMATT